MGFSVGDTAYYRDHSGKVSKGTVIQIEGGKDGNLTEVWWPDLNQVMWYETERLWDIEPSWGFDQRCTCGCTFGDHSISGCIPHQIHRFIPVTEGTQ